MPLSREEGEAHAAAHDQGVHPVDEMRDDAELVGNLGAAQHHGVGTIGVVEHLAEDLRLRFHQQTGGVRQQLCHIGDGRLLAVDDTETVGNERVAEGSQFLGERLPLFSDLARLPGVETHVFQQRDAAGGKRRDCGLGGGPDQVGCVCHRLTEQLTEAHSDRFERVRRIRLTLGSAEMRHQNHRRAALEQIRDCGQRGLDAPVVGDGPRFHALCERHVEVNADQHPTAGYI